MASAHRERNGQPGEKRNPFTDAGEEVQVVFQLGPYPLGPVLGELARYSWQEQHLHRFSHPESVPKMGRKYPENLPVSPKTFYRRPKT